jgi:hypothetical protein
MRDIEEMEGAHRKCLELLVQSWRIKRARYSRRRRVGEACTVPGVHRSKEGILDTSADSWCPALQAEEDSVWDDDEAPAVERKVWPVNESTTLV